MASQAVTGNPNLQALMERAVLMGRIAKVEEITDVIMFLCGTGATYVTGSSSVVDGGITLGSGIV